MADRVSDNLAMLMRVVDRLGPLRERLVFLGGAVTELFITQPGGPGPRQTKDVDVVIDVVNLGEYSETLRDQLVALGLREDTREGAPVCRWHGLIRLVTPACFIATKLAAFGDRGRRNPTASHDLEDMIAVIDSRPEIIGDVAAAPADLRAAIAAGLEAVLALPEAEDVIAAQLLPDAKSQDRLPFVLDRIRGLIAAAT
ncbi:MAG: hypothetical protein NTW36_00530 [Planctomycetia bacterium]|nr:hypothetical protein [Planctomycetia bacterium]